MKCLVLAGGSSDRLWPLSRKDYPKQFMEIREGRSMFQETILRNIPFCDEFIILTNKRYENIVKGQLQAFQGLNSTVVCESEEGALKTAPPVIAYAKDCDPDEQLLIVSSECLVDGDYAESMARVREIAAGDRMAIVVCKPTNAREGYNFINLRGKTVSCSPKRGKNSLWDCGIMGVKAWVLLSVLPRATVEDCAGLRVEKGVLVSDRPVTPVNLSKILHTDKCDLVPASFEWTRITDITSFYEYVGKAAKNNDNTIAYNCKGVEIVNTLESKLVVANGLKNIVIVNTRDALYVSDKSREADAKSIAQKYYNGKKRYFDVQPKRYMTWGTSETLYYTEQIVVNKVVLYPGEHTAYRCRRGYTANLLVLQGTALLRGKDTEIDYAVDQSIVIADTAAYEIANTGKTPLEMLCTLRRQKTNGQRRKEADLLVRLAPVFKDNLWGGTRIRDVFHKDVGGMEIVAESWELSAHPDGMSRIAEGEFAGMTFPEYIEAVGKDKLGWKAQGYDKFPVMIKFIDARQNLSIQVHPADEYALSVEGQYGKSEMWYILEAEENACIYVGFNRDVTPDEVRERIRNDTLMEVLNRVPVKKGDAYFLAAGTVHAIGAGCFICEVQQSSNVTYRLYDYGRTDKNGNKRELHVDKALDVVDMHAVSPRTFDRYNAVMGANFVRSVVGECKYFSVTQYFVDGECDLPASEASFQAVVVIEGEGTISDESRSYPCRAGDTFFSAAKNRVTLKGKLKALVANV